jgi:23S rRNA (adenine2503-C2)-methyltransferase
MISIYDPAGIEELRRRHAVQPHCMKLFRNALFKHFVSRDEALAVLPDRVRADFARQVAFSSLELIERRDSEIDGASKLVFRTADRRLIESVILRPATGRTSLCVSSQVGCACRCAFCATGMMGFGRDLTADEILDQVRQAACLTRAEGRTMRNVVFMGMGEPLLNPDGVSGALELLLAPPFFNYSGSKLMVSTVGIPPAMEAFGQAFPRVQLALSLHSARQEVREQLMPVAARYPLERLRTAIAGAARNGKVMVEYLMLEGLNDSMDDADVLAAYLMGLPVHINIIPFNRYDGAPYRGSPRPVREAFANRLKAGGFETTLRRSLGSDIAAACGQLARPARSA